MTTLRRAWSAILALPPAQRALVAAYLVTGIPCAALVTLALSDPKHHAWLLLVVAGVWVVLSACSRVAMFVHLLRRGRRRRRRGGRPADPHGPGERRRQTDR